MRVSLELLRANAKEPPRVHQALSTLGGMTIPSLFKDIMKETVESIPPPTFSEEDIKSLSQASIKIAKHQRKSAEPGDASFQEDIQDSTAAVTEAVEKSKEEVTQAIQDSLVRVTDELRQTQEMVRSGGQSTTLYTGGIHWEQEAAFKALSEKIDSLREEVTGQPPGALTTSTGETGDMTGALLRVEQNQTKVFDSIDQIQFDLKQLAASVSHPVYVPGSQPTLAAMASSAPAQSQASSSADQPEMQQQVTEEVTRQLQQQQRAIERQLASNLSTIMAAIHKLEKPSGRPQWKP